MCFALNDLRPVAIQPVEPSQIGWRIRERGRLSASTVETVHQTMRRIRPMNSGSISEKWATATRLLRQEPRVEEAGRGAPEDGCQPEEPQLCSPALEHRRIQMATRDMPDRIAHAEDRQTERECDSQEANAQLRKRAREHGAAAASQRAPKGSDQLGGRSFADGHEGPPIADCLSGARASHADFSELSPGGIHAASNREAAYFCSVRRGCAVLLVIGMALVVGTVAFATDPAGVGAPPPVPVPEPSELALRWYRTGIIVWIVGLLWSLAVPAVVFASGLSARLAALAQLPSRRLFFVTALYALLYTSVALLLMLPFDWYATFLRPHAYGLSSQTEAKWISDTLVSFALSAG